MYEHNALGYWSGLALCLTKIRSSRARCPATALIYKLFLVHVGHISGCTALDDRFVQPFFRLTHEEHLSVSGERNVY